MNDGTKTSTSDLWDATHSALCSQRWSEARGLLDELLLRNDNNDKLCDAEVYGCPESGYRSILQDRINSVNHGVIKMGL